MVKHKSYIDADRSLAEYRMRTPFANPVPVSSRTTNGQRTGRQRPNDPFYHSEGRIDKNDRNRKGQNPNGSTADQQPKTNNVQTANAKKGGCCCTIL
jgi:hypothetical protein